MSIEDNPSIFMQLAKDPGAIMGLILLLVGAGSVATTELEPAIVGATSIAGGIALISNAFFIIKKSNLVNEIRVYDSPGINFSRV